MLTLLELFSSEKTFKVKISLCVFGWLASIRRIAFRGRPLFLLLRCQIWVTPSLSRLCPRLCVSSGESPSLSPLSLLACELSTGKVSVDVRSRQLFPSLPPPLPKAPLPSHLPPPFHFLVMSKNGSKISCSLSSSLTHALAQRHQQQHGFEADDDARECDNDGLSSAGAVEALRLEQQIIVADCQVRIWTHVVIMLR